MSAPPDSSAGASTRDGHVTVVGGTYRERCIEPKIDDLHGSGLRAAALLTSLGRPTSFHTCIESDATAKATAIFSAYGLAATEYVERPASVEFNYDTPVSPARWGYNGEAAEIEVSASRVVAFGMIDATWTVNADTVVLDPQHGDLSALLAGVTAQSIAVVLNGHEAARLTGLPAAEAGPALLALPGVDVVVIKQGALGGLVFAEGSTSTYGPVPTTSTRTIGSGDAFTAGFAHSWFNNPDDPLAAAVMGAQVAAAHSMTDVPQVTQQTLTELPSPLPYVGDNVPSIYLAAPFFSTAERLLVETARSALLDAGLRVFSPLHDVGRGGDEVAEKDLDGLRACNAVLALLDGYDPGTLFETGWAHHAGIPVVGFAEHPDDHQWTMLRGTGAIVSSDLTSAIHSAAWSAIRHSSTATTSGVPT